MFAEKRGFWQNTANTVTEASIILFYILNDFIRGLLMDMNAMRIFQLPVTHDLFQKQIFA
jgi:hypothetical protein